MNDKQQEFVFKEQMMKKLKGFKTKIIVANSVAESCITIDGVKVVIDSGLSREVFYDPERKIKVFKT
jgi:ATP-dependent helicase HrpB